MENRAEFFKMRVSVLGNGFLRRVKSWLCEGGALPKLRRFLEVFQLGEPIKKVSAHIIEALVDLGFQGEAGQVCYGSKPSLRLISAPASTKGKANISRSKIQESIKQGKLYIYYSKEEVWLVDQKTAESSRELTRLLTFQDLRKIDLAIQQVFSSLTQFRGQRNALITLLNRQIEGAPLTDCQGVFLDTEAKTVLEHQGNNPEALVNKAREGTINLFYLRHQLFVLADNSGIDCLFEAGADPLELATSFNVGARARTTEHVALPDSPEGWAAVANRPETRMMDKWPDEEQ